MQGIVALLDKSVRTKETRLLMGRLMRQTAQLRGHMNAADLQAFVSTYLPAGSKSGAYLEGFVKQVGGALWAGWPVGREGRRSSTLQPLQFMVARKAGRTACMVACRSGVPPCTGRECRFLLCTDPLRASVPCITPFFNTPCLPLPSCPAPPPTGCCGGSCSHGGGQQQQRSSSSSAGRRQVSSSSG